MMIDTRILEKIRENGISDEQLQADLLAGVSRTFALTIPQLPVGLRNTVSNAYLLCRAIDTIEDEPALDFEEKKTFCNWFTDVVEQKSDPRLFSEALSPLLSDSTIPMEHVLIQKIDRVVNITYKFDESHQQALSRCVRIMSEGMIFFQELESNGGLKDLEEMDKYCYHVAGVVGEMLTDLFILYLPAELSGKREEMMKLGVSFGQGLQMTNILKDIWDDQKRGVCWLPNDVFSYYGYDLAQLKSGQVDENFQQGLIHLIGVAHTHLHNAFKYTLMLPADQTGIRNFCLWATFMSVLTLKKIFKNLNSTNSSDWKISRNSVKQVVVMTKLTVRSDSMLKAYFNMIRRGLPENSVIFTE